MYLSTLQSLSYKSSNMFRVINDPYVGIQITKLYAYIHRFEFEFEQLFLDPRLKLTEKQKSDYQTRIVNISERYIQTYNDIKSTSKFQSLKEERKVELSHYFIMFYNATKD